MLIADVEYQETIFDAGVVTWWRLVLIHGVPPHIAAREMWGFARG